MAGGPAAPDTYRMAARQLRLMDTPLVLGLQLIMEPGPACDVLMPLCNSPEQKQRNGLCHETVVRVGVSEEQRAPKVVVWAPDTRHTRRTPSWLGHSLPSGGLSLGVPTEVGVCGTLQLGCSFSWAGIGICTFLIPSQS